MTLVAGSTVTIDTNPRQGSAQGLKRRYPEGTPICRIDVLTYAVANGALVVDENQGAGPQPLADGIEDLQVQVVSDLHYRLTLRARSSRRDPVSGLFLPETGSTDVALRN